MNYDPKPPSMVYLFGDSFFDNAEERTKAEKQRAFDAYLMYLADGNTKAYSYRRAGLTYSQIENRRKSSTEFAGLEEKALADGVECLVQEAKRRAVHGVEEDVYYKGEVVGQKRVYSDSLLQTLLKAKDPSFRETRNVVTADVTSTVSAGAPAIDYTKFSEEELLQFEELLMKGGAIES